MPGFTYKSYSFTEKDPIIDEIRTVYERSGANYVWVHEHSGVSTATLTGWFTGATKKPQAATVNAVLRALGYKLGIVEMRAVRVEPALPQPVARKPVSTRHIVQMAKYRGAKR